MHLYCQFLCFEKITHHAFVYNSHFSTKYKSEFCGAIIDNRSYALIYVLEENDRKGKAALKNLLRKVFDGKLVVEFAFKVNAHDSP